MYRWKIRHPNESDSPLAMCEEYIEMIWTVKVEYQYFKIKG